MIAANNLTAVFDYLLPIVSKATSINKLLNHQNSTGNTPIRK
jgi:hypothetical protein